MIAIGCRARGDSCADIFIQVNNYTMKPLEEYMLFTRTGAENITVINSQGVRSCQCSLEFDVTEKNVPEPSLNFTVVCIYNRETDETFLC